VSFSVSSWFQFLGFLWVAEFNQKTKTRLLLTTPSAEATATSPLAGGEFKEVLQNSPPYEGGVPEGRDGSLINHK
jgi:hypothetical protein